MADNDNSQGFSSDLLAWAAARASGWPHLFSGLIDRYLELNGLSEEELCERLHCDRDTLNHLRLCGRPDPDPAEFTVDIQRVADKLNLDAGRLASIVREVDAAGAFVKAGSEVSPFSSTPAMLQAARDREGGPGFEDQESGGENEGGGEPETSLEEGKEEEPGTGP